MTPSGVEGSVVAAQATPQGTSPLTPEQLEAIALAKQLSRRVSFANTIALMNVATLGLFGALSILLSAVNLQLSFIGLALVLVAVNEERGRRQLQALRPESGVTLARNQLLLMCVIVIYCGFNIYESVFGPDQLQQLMEQSPELEAAMGDLSAQAGESFNNLNQVVRTSVALFYGIVAVVGGAVTGATAYYYNRLRTAVKDLAALPAWAKALL